MLKQVDPFAASRVISEVLLDRPVGQPDIDVLTRTLSGMIDRMHATEARLFRSALATPRHRLRYWPLLQHRDLTELTRALSVLTDRMEPGESSRFYNEVSLRLALTLEKTGKSADRAAISSVLAHGQRR